MGTIISKPTKDKRLNPFRFDSSIIHDYFLNNYIHALTIDLKGTTIWHVKILEINVEDQSLLVEYCETYTFKADERFVTTIYGIKSYCTTTDQSNHEGDLYLITNELTPRIQMMRANDDTEASHKFQTYLDLNKFRFPWMKPEKLNLLSLQSTLVRTSE